MHRSLGVQTVRVASHIAVEEREISAHIQLGVAKSTGTGQFGFQMHIEVVSVSVPLEPFHTLVQGPVPTVVIIPSVSEVPTERNQRRPVETENLQC